ncbi:hypothetical protein BC826DRAFT_1102703 [Russula brevipes]|nr:hypothetical protein BC826DRAFT_1102703 [Russula brevipes]
MADEKRTAPSPSEHLLQISSTLIWPAASYRLGRRRHRSRHLRAHKIDLELEEFPPIHTRSLLVPGLVPKDDVLHDDDGRFREVPIAVEQRVSNLAQGSLYLVLLTGPLLPA